MIVVNSGDGLVVLYVLNSFPINRFDVFEKQSKTKQKIRVGEKQSDLAFFQRAEFVWLVFLHAGDVDGCGSTEASETPSCRGLDF